jgi:hypothetical protein
MFRRLCRRIEGVDDEKALPLGGHAPQSSSAAVNFKSVSSADILLLSGSTASNGAKELTLKLAACFY